ncbi:MAG: phosphoenolpyruvate synthase, partial [Chloroflexi bacterium]|nr:phosphoenolpyruvate synthase [Chloroflexota bacterium]
MSQRRLDPTGNHGTAYVLPFEQIRMVDSSLVGGKGADLGELTSAGFPVPPGFCVTISAFEQFIATQADIGRAYMLLDAIEPGDVERVRHASQQMRAILQQAPIPAAVAQAITQMWLMLGREHAYAVRSSATAEDLPGASFAGQQDTYLNVRGETALLDSIRNCWASLFTERAILYRLQHGFGHRQISIAVVVQRMVEPQVAGVMFTADPVTGDRSIISIDASFGLGEALVAGLVSADLYQVDKRERRLLKRQIADKHMLIRPAPEGGTVRVELSGDAPTQPALTDAQVLELAALGARIEAHYGTPQDIEWALDAGGCTILQARPITTLYPLPQPLPHDDALHIYFSFNHFQVMTDPMPDLAISLWRVMVHVGCPAGELENPYLCVAGGRIYIDLSPLLHHRVLGPAVPGAFASIDAPGAQAIAAVAGRESFRRRGHAIRSRALIRFVVPILSKVIVRLVWNAPEGAAALGLRLMNQHLAQAKELLAAAPDLVARLKTATSLLLSVLSPIFRDWFPYFIAGETAYGLLQRLMRGIATPDDLVAVARGLQGNVVTGMDLAVGDLADRVRRFPSL